MPSNENKRQHIFCMESDQVYTIYEPHVVTIYDDGPRLIIVTNFKIFELDLKDDDHLRRSIRNFNGGRVPSITIT